MVNPKTPLDVFGSEQSTPVMEPKSGPDRVRDPKTNDDFSFSIEAVEELTEESAGALRRLLERAISSKLQRYRKEVIGSNLNVTGDLLRPWALDSEEVAHLARQILERFPCVIDDAVYDGSAFKRLRALLRKIDPRQQYGDFEEEDEEVEEWKKS